MLRRKSRCDHLSENRDIIPFPEAVEPFVLGGATTGVHFYCAGKAFHLPYSGLQAMYLGDQTLILVFATDEVRIEGRGLHSLYVNLAEQRVKRVHEQNERYEALADSSPVFIRKITRDARPSGTTHSGPTLP